MSPGTGATPCGVAVCEVIVEKSERAKTDTGCRQGTVTGPESAVSGEGHSLQEKVFCAA